MTSFHSATFGILGSEPPLSPAAQAEVEQAERRLGFALPASVREWYCYEGAINILATHSNKDSPIALGEFVVQQWQTRRLLPFQLENQGVCVWAILLNGSEDPPVYVDVDSDGRQWQMHAPTFSAYVGTCVWDYACVLHRPALVAAQNKPLSPAALNELRARYSEQPVTFGSPGSAQYRFAGDDRAILIWISEGQADWFIGALDAKTLETALRSVWRIDDVGESLYDCSEIGKAVLDKIRGER